VLLERVGLTGAANRRVGTYSGGMRRRLDLALSLVHEPSVLFLDEPTTGLDPTSRTALWEEVRRLNAEGTTVFLTTQYLEEADELAGRVAIIDNGRIVREGNPQVLKTAIGADTLVVSVGNAFEVRAAEVLAQFGSARAAKAGAVAIGIVGGGASLSGALRALEEAGIPVEHVELDAPSLDDVFADATGRRLEGAAAPDEEPELA
jgi:ABC-2 type transport system ATP-binding protein